MLSVHKELVRIQSDSTQVEGMLEVPAKATGMVLFAHGSGSSRFSPRNNFVASELHNVQIGTLLLDLLTPEEDQNYRRRFDISLLVQRLNKAAEWLRENAATRSLPLALFGASTGAAAALQLAASWGAGIAAVVSRGGRPDMAGLHALEKVSAPTLLIVGGLDDAVIKMNQAAYDALHCEKQLEIIPGATHLFEEPGTLEQVAVLAATWFVRHFPTQDKY